LKESESAQLKELQEVYKTQENLLTDMKLKFEKSDANMKKLKNEMYHKDSYLNGLLNMNEEYINNIFFNLFVIFKSLTGKMADLNQEIAPAKQKYIEFKEKVKEEFLDVRNLK
jgi:hypothetical protein